MAVNEGLLQIVMRSLLSWILSISQHKGLEVSSHPARNATGEKTKLSIRDELQALLQKRLDVLHVELYQTMHGRAETLQEKLNAVHIADMLAGSRMELQLLARFLGVPVESEIEVARSEVDDALYPSSETYENYVKGTCGCAHNHNNSNRKVS